MATNTKKAKAKQNKAVKPAEPVKRRVRTREEEDHFDLCKTGDRLKELMEDPDVQHALEDWRNCILSDGLECHSLIPIVFLDAVERHIRSLPTMGPMEKLDYWQATRAQ